MRIQEEGVLLKTVSDSKDEEDHSRPLLIAVGVLLPLVMGLTYYRFMYLRDYDMLMHLPCDPRTQACFVAEGETPEDDRSYYYVLQKKAANIPACDPTTDECLDKLTCARGEKRCKITFCGDHKPEREKDARCSNASDVAAVAETNREASDASRDVIDTLPIMKVNALETSASL
jgi:hypothetical protein